jgi:hypothetical protein
MAAAAADLEMATLETAAVAAAGLAQQDRRILLRRDRKTLVAAAVASATLRTH